MKTAPFLLLVASGPALLVGELSAKLTERLFFHEACCISWRAALWDGPYALWFTNHEPRATSHKPRATSHEPQATSHEPRTTNHEPQATSHEPRTTRYRVIKDILITQFLPKNSLTYHIRDDKISKCRNECIASKLQDVRSEVS